MEEAEFPIEAYSSIAKIFTRRLKPHIRPVQTGVVSPVDGTLRAHGVITDGSLPQIKDRTYSVAQFLGDSVLASRFSGGYFFSLYLSPRDYHRVHSPYDGRVVFRRHIPGKLWPVNDWAMSRLEGLFTINERVVMGMETKLGLMAVVMIGATNVGKISLTFDPLITNRVCAAAQQERLAVFQPGVSVRAGDELGMFHLGSSVVVLFEAGRISDVQAELGPVKYGQTLSVPKVPPEFG